MGEIESKGNRAPLISANIFTTSMGAAGIIPVAPKLFLLPIYFMAVRFRKSVLGVPKRGLKENSPRPLFF